jgi:hypothetical protein
MAEPSRIEDGTSGPTSEGGIIIYGQWIDLGWLGQF